MKLPNLYRATVSKEKISGYLLNRQHPAGGPKALYFYRHGFRVQRWEQLAEALLNHARQNPVESTSQTPYGICYTIAGRLLAPSGAFLKIRSVWFIENGEESPKLVTAYPIHSQWS